MSHTKTPAKITLEFYHECCTDDFAHIAIAELVDKWRQIEGNETLVDGRFDKACEEFEAECRATKNYIQTAIDSFEAMKSALIFARDATHSKDPDRLRLIRIMISDALHLAGKE